MAIEIDRYTIQYLYCIILYCQTSIVFKRNGEVWIVDFGKYGLYTSGNRFYQLRIYELKSTKSRLPNTRLQH